MAIESPYEVLELAAGQSVRIRVERWEVGEMSISPRDGRAAKVIRVLRLHVPRPDKPTFPHYWDATATTLIAQLLPMLPDIRDRRRSLTITKVGSGPSARFAVDVAPATPAP